MKQFKPLPPERVVVKWMGTWKVIFALNRLAGKCAARQPDRLRQMVGTTELAGVLGCGASHASDLRSGRRNPTPEQIEKITTYVSRKISL